MADVRVRVGVVVLEEEHILLVEHDKRGRRYALLPGGGVEAGETLAEAAVREVREETGLDVEVGGLLIVCESIEPRRFGTRHLVNLVYAGRRVGGELRAGRDGRLVEVGWVPVEMLARSTMYPPIAQTVAACCAEGLMGPTRILGNVWATVEERAG